MNAKTRIEHLTDLIRGRLPEAAVTIDAPPRESDPWFVDVRVGEQSIVVEFRSDLGFGLSTQSSESYGEGADEFMEKDEDVAARIVTLVRSGQRTSPQRVHLLQELREHRNVSQVALATKLGIRQPTVSKIERREDVALSTLRRYVEALGGTLQITARFPDYEFEIGFGPERALLP